MKFGLASLLVAGAAGVLAQAPYATSIEPATNSSEIFVNRGSAALWQSLKKLHTRASLIMITAHPDDEDGGMLAYEIARARARGWHLLTLNRGEGGANVMSPDYFDALGLVRTHGAAGGGPLLRRGSVLDARDRLRLLENQGGIDRQVDA